MREKIYSEQDRKRNPSAIKGTREVESDIQHINQNRINVSRTYITRLRWFLVRYSYRYRNGLAVYR